VNGLLEASSLTIKACKTIPGAILDFLFVSSLASAAVFQNNNPVKIKQKKEV